MSSVDSNRPSAEAFIECPACNGTRGLPSEIGPLPCAMCCVTGVIPVRSLPEGKTPADYGKTPFTFERKPLP
jgi:hypothetical protein